MEASAQGRPYDSVMAQIGLSVISMHSMADMLTQVLYDLCERDELVQALRDEVISVIQAEGLTVTALNKLRLMDSTLKESQRMKPSLVAVMQRIADEDVALSDGTIIPKDSQTIVASTAKTRDPSVYPDPDTFDPYRFLKLRQTAPDKETYAQATTPSPDHMGMGIGQACLSGTKYSGYRDQDCSLSYSPEV